MDNEQSSKHSTAQSVILHLLPGILIGCFFFLVRQPVIKLGYPSVLALILAVAFILVPFELGYLLVQGKKTTGRYTLKGVISYRRSIPWWQYIVWGVVVFVAIGVIFTLLKPVEAVLQEKVFSWLPGMDAGLDGNTSRATLIVTYVLFFIFIVVLGPLVEELYFRGYLLPRMKGKFGMVFNSFLFAAYHIFTPWMIITRTIGLLPLIYAVKKKNIYIGIFVHILLNSLDLLMAVAFITKMD